MGPVLQVAFLPYDLQPWAYDEIYSGDRSENDFSRISRDSRGEDIFLEINILSFVSDMFDVITSIVAENDI